MKIPFRKSVFVFFFLFPFLLLNQTHESRRYKTGGDGYHRNAYHTYHAAQQPSQCRNRIDIPITHGGERHYSPPKTVADIGKGFGLCLVFDIVHQDARESQQDASSRTGRYQFILHHLQHTSDKLERAGIAYQLKYH